MREVKYRGRRLDNGAWEYGDLIENQGRNFIYHATSETTIEDNDDGRIVIAAVEVDHNTVGQYTGLKDRNGKKIYEGDILHERVAIRIVDRRIVKFCYGSFIAESTYNQGAQCYGEPHEKFQSLKYFSVNDIKIEVVGNIHDNSEFLKGGEQ